MQRSVFTIIVTGILGTAFGSAASLAADYSYIQGSYGRIDLDSVGLNVDGDGIGISGSFALDRNFYLYGEYQTADPGFGIDLDLTEFGVGYHTDVTPRLDVYANLGFLDLETNVGGGDDGFLFGIGLRGPLNESVELYGGLDYIDFDSTDSETRANAGFLISLTERLGVGLEASFWDDVNIFQLNGRYYFE